jgi:hypothetical protein
VRLQVCQWVFGQEFPAPDSPLGQQVMSVATAMVGLAAFAMVLALVEQVVLETLEANVKRGSKVFESGHVSHCWTELPSDHRQRASLMLVTGLDGAS